jgi:hypothetical protein
MIPIVFIFLCLVDCQWSIIAYVWFTHNVGYTINCSFEIKRKVVLALT